MGIVVTRGWYSLAFVTAFILDLLAHDIVLYRELIRLAIEVIHCTKEVKVL